MGKVIPMLGGGGGADLDVITAGAGDVLTGKVIVDRKGDPLTGTMSNNISGTKAVSLALWNGDLYYRIPKGAYLQPGSSDGYPEIKVAQADVAATVGVDGSKMLNSLNLLGVQGQIIDRGVGGHAVSSGINASGLWYYFAPGYYPNDGTGNCWVYRTVSEVVNTLGIQSVVSFNVAQYSNLTLIASWARPTKGPWSGVVVMCKQGGYPNNVSDGTVFYDGSGTSAMKSLGVGTWYFRAWNYITTNQGRFYNNNAVTGNTVNNSTVQGSQTFTSSGIFTVPNAVRRIDVFCVGGGGAGGSAVFNSGGGGGGGYTNYGTFNVLPGQQYYVSIGAGGDATTGNVHPGNTTSFGTLISAAGGGGGMEYNGGAGGSGGGQRGLSRQYAGRGGSDGGNGALIGQLPGIPFTGAAGQGRTTRLFGETSGTLYAGGGGGGASDSNQGNAGGEGGGGAGCCNSGSSYPVSGTANTGGGGGGARYRGEDYHWTGSRIGAAGGSGICIIRW